MMSAAGGVLCWMTSTGSRYVHPPCTNGQAGRAEPAPHILGMIPTPAISPIVRVPVMPFGMVNAFALIGLEKVVLVDAGLPDTVPRFEEVLAGGAWQLRETTRAPIVAPRDELPYLSGDTPPPLCPTGPFGRFFLRAGAPLAPWRHFEPDIQLGEESLELAPFGLEGHVESTPGHTPGSLSVRAPWAPRWWVTCSLRVCSSGGCA